MARIRSLTQGTQKVGEHDGEVDCFHQVIDGRDGPVLHLTTFGSDDRQTHAKSSQSLQFDREQALRLVEVISATFGIAATEQGTASTEDELTQRETDLPVSDLEASDRQPIIKVAATDTIARARTLMITRDFSQLPVVRGKGNRAIGMISWETIGRSAVVDAAGTVADAMKPLTDTDLVDLDHRLMDVIPRINRDGYAVTVGRDRTMRGIVTSADLGEALAAIAGPYVELARCETIVRRLVQSALDSRRLTAERVSTLADRAHFQYWGSVHELPLGTLIVLFDSDEVWASLTTWADRATVVNDLHEVAAARNALMHFRRRTPTHESALERLPKLNVLLASMMSHSN